MLKATLSKNCTTLLRASRCIRRYRARFCIWFLTVAFLLLNSIDAMARVGGGQGYGGGGGGGDDDGGAIAWVVIEIIRFLIYLTIEYPVVGIPLDIIVVCAVIYYFIRKGKKGPTTFTSASTSSTLGLTSPTNQRSVAASFEQLRRFDPNFSEIVFTDFAYTLYAKAHYARGKGPKELDQLSPYLSDAARKALIQINPPGLQEVKGIIIGAMTGGFSPRTGNADGECQPGVRSKLHGGGEGKRPSSRR